MTTFKPPPERKLKAAQDLAPEDMAPLSPGAAAVWGEVRDVRCTRCALADNCKYICMMGEGPVPSKAMVIGESPGWVEDRVGRPFKADAGMYLEGCFNDVELDLIDMYVTNAVKCHPPKVDKDALVKAAVKPCREYLEEEIRRVKPDVILVLGAPALKAVLKMDGITKKRGHEYWSEEFNCWIVVAMHPAWVLRNPHGHEDFLSDMKRFARRLRGEEPKQPEVRECTTPEQVKECFDHFEQCVEEGKPFAFDFETKGYFHYKPDAKIWMISLSDDPQLGWAIPLEHPESPFSDTILKMEIWPRLKRLLERGKTIGHNVKFDAKWGRIRDIVINIYYDTMVAAHLINENRRVSLEALAASEFGAGEWGKKKIKFDPPSPLADMLPYGGRDAAHTYELFLLTRRQLEERQGLARLYKHACLPGIAALTQAETHGIWVDPTRLATRISETADRTKALEGGLTEHIQPGLRELANTYHAKGKRPFDSTKFLQSWLFGVDGLQLQPIRKTKTGYSVDEETLDALRSQHPAVELVMQLRHEVHMGQFFESWRGFMDRDNRLHPSHNMTGTRTGRRSCSDPNIEQVPRDPYQRSVFGAPPGCRFCEADYSQVEMRIAAHLSSDPVMMLAFQLERDIHSLTAAMVTGRLTEIMERHSIAAPIEELLYNDAIMAEMEASVTKEERRMAKAVNFGFLYGMGANGFLIYAKENYGIEVNKKDAEDFRNLFFSTYRGLVTWHERQRRTVWAKREVENPIGRIRRLPNIMSSDEMTRGSAERQAINAPDQGFGADLTLISYGRLGTGELDWRECRFVGDIHDAILFEILEDKVDKWVPIIKQIMEDKDFLRQRFGLTLEVPLVVEPAVGQHWGETEEWKVAA